MKKIAICILVLVGFAGTVQAQNTKAKQSQITFLDSKLFDGQLGKELQGDNDSVEVKVTGKISLNNIPARVDKWITIVGENGELTVKAAESTLEPKFIFALIPVIYSFLKQANEERVFDSAKKYNATIFYRVDASSGESLIEKIVFTRKK